MKRGGARGAAILLGILAAGCTRSTNVQTGNATQVLHRGIGPDLADLDPHLATQTSYYTVLSALLEGLVAEDPVDLHPVPGVAEAWETSPDGLTYTFHLRPSAHWSDGRPVGADDFIGSWQRILSPALGAFYASQLYIIEGAEAFSRGDGSFAQVGLRAPDPHTLIVRLEHPAPWFLSVLSGPAWLPVPLDVIRRHGGLTDRANRWASPEFWVGNGPFVLAAWHHGQEIVVRRSATYWDEGQIRLKEIHFHAFDSNDAEERAFRTGQVHLTEAIPPDKVDGYRRTAPDLLRVDPLLGTYFLRINVRQPALNDGRIRLALSLAVDRAALTDRILRGGQVPALAFTPPGLGGYRPDGLGRNQADRARQLLAAAGHPGGEGLPAFALLYNTSENNRLIAEALQEMWRRELGLRVTLANQDLKSMEAARAAGAYELLRSSWIADYTDPSAFLEVWRSDSSNNFTGWKNPDFDNLLFTAARTADAAARNALYGRAESLLLAESPIIPLYHYTHVFLLRPSVQGWSPTLLDHHPYKAVWLRAQ